MSRPANAPPAEVGRGGAFGPSTAGRGPALRFAQALVALGLGVTAMGYVAGMFLLLSLGGEAHNARLLTWLQYAVYLHEEPDIRLRLWGSALATVGLSAIGAALVLWPRRPPLHGAARFATRREIRSAGLLGNHGIVLGRLGRRYLLLPGQQGVALAAPPRAGKGAGIVIPNALHWPGSLVCIDLKRENWTVTAGFRAACGQACYLFEPFAEDRRTARWNPFHYVSADPVRRINDLQRIADMLYPDPPTGDPFWIASARAVFLAIALYLFETPAEEKTIGNVLRKGMASDAEGFGEHWKRIVEGRRVGDHPLSESCVRALYDVIDLAPSTASSIRKTFTSRLDLWLNPILDAATAGNDFDLRELRRRPMSIYVGVNPDDLHRLRPVLNLFFQQAIGLQTRELPEHNPALRYQVMMLLDEFTALGRLPIIAEAISYLPGYNVRVVLVIQTPAQLREVYGPHNAETMIKSLAARIVFTPKDMADAREISEELGYTTVEGHSHSKPKPAFNLGQVRSGSETISEQRRALRLPQEIKALPATEQILFYEGLAPIRCTRIRYFTDKVFRQRLLAPPARPEPVVAQYRVVSGPAPSKGAGARSACTGSKGQARAAVRESRVATVADLFGERPLTLGDFDADVEALRFVLDADGRIHAASMARSAEGFLDAVTDAPAAGWENRSRGESG